MRTSPYSIFDFLKDCRGNWRNAVFIPCEACDHPCSNQRRGSLLTADADGHPRAVCVSRFEAATGQRVEGHDCIGLLSKSAFASVFQSYLTWSCDDPESCCLRYLDGQVSTAP